MENTRKGKILTKMNGLSENLPKKLNYDFININVK